MLDNLDALAKMSHEQMSLVLQASGADYIKSIMASKTMTRDEKIIALQEAAFANVKDTSKQEEGHTRE